MGIRIKGLDDALAAIAKGNKLVTRAARKAIVKIANDVGRRADQLVPFDTGALRNSQTISLPSPASKKISAAIQYGGPAAPYAVVQHERLDLWHPPKPPGKTKVGGRQGSGPVSPGMGRGPKYLEYPLNQKRATFAKDIVDAIQKELP